MPSEKSTYSRFRANLAGTFHRISRVENPIAPGMPDVNCCFIDVGEFWIEVKTPKEPKRNETRLFGSNHEVGVHQINWHRYQHQCGGRSFFLIDTDKRLMLIPGALAERINGMTVLQLERVALFCATKPMGKGKWNDLKIALQP